MMTMQTFDPYSIESFFYDYSYEELYGDLDTAYTVEIIAVLYQRLPEKATKWKALSDTKQMQLIESSHLYNFKSRDDIETFWKTRIDLI